MAPIASASASRLAGSVGSEELAEVLPDALDRIELGRVGWQPDQEDVLGNDQRVRDVRRAPSRTRRFRVSGKALENSSRKAWKQTVSSAGSSRKKASPEAGSTAP
jgi:hypothetical protein